MVLGSLSRDTYATFYIVFYSRYIVYSRRYPGIAIALDAFYYLYANIIVLLY
jgi:hypothetical protein